MSQLLADDFLVPRRPGRVLGPGRGGEPPRMGIDRERIMSIDGGALRIRPPLVEGWERTCLAYGPFPNRTGLALSVLALNGHNTSQSETMSDTLWSRLERWARGSGAMPVRRRLWRWLRSGRVGRFGRQLRWWRRIAVGSTRVQPMDENFAVTFCPGPVCHPLDAGTGFVMHADGPRNGELWAGAVGAWSPVLSGVQNLPIHYVLVIRENDVLALASSLSGARGLPALPGLRPLAVVPRPSGQEVYATIHQCLLGQIGFRADTRIEGVRVAELLGLHEPGACAVAADFDLAGAVLTGRRALRGGEWVAFGDAWVLETGVPTGLVRAQIDPVALSPAGVSIVLRAGREGSRVELRLSRAGVGLYRVADDGIAEVASQGWELSAGVLQVLDDGRALSVVADGRLLFGRHIDLTEPPANGASGVVAIDGMVPPGLVALEAFPRTVPMPVDLVAGRPWQPEPGVDLWTDPLTAPAGDLAGRVTPDGRARWERLIGSGHLEFEAAGGVRWRASVGEPLPDRTVYAFDWTDESFAELEVDLTPPGLRRGEREHGTAGFCLWQDKANYLLINTWLDDCYEGASLSSFFCIDGFEDIYDAIWTNVGDRILWGRPLRLKLASDGLRYLVSINGEPVLYRALSDVYPGCHGLRIRKVGLLGNWEWGADTGSRFADLRVADSGDSNRRQRRNNDAI